MDLGLKDVGPENSETRGSVESGMWDAKTLGLGDVGT